MPDSAVLLADFEGQWDTSFRCPRFHRLMKMASHLQNDLSDMMATAHFINNLDKGLPDDYIVNNIKHLR
jgi:hypothetical protein